MEMKPEVGVNLRHDKTCQRVPNKKLHAYEKRLKRNGNWLSGLN